MRLLVVTQRVDLNSDVLGFFHAWLVELAARFDTVVTVTLFEGEARLPQNVKIRSLGKESGYSRLHSVLLFFKHAWHERNHYDVAFVHMTPIFTVLGWPIWRLLRKKRLLWYNHRQGGLLARLAFKASDRIFYTSGFSFSSRCDNAQIMPAGVSTDLFCNTEGVEPVPSSLLYLGRLSPVKKIDCLIEAAKLLDREEYLFTLEIVGSPAVSADRAYEERLRTISRELQEKGRIQFLPGVRNIDAPRLYSKHELFINLTPSGSFDKTVLEAMSCESLVLVSNRSFESVLPTQFLFEENDAYDLANKIRTVLALSRDDKRRYRREFRGYVVSQHGVGRLAREIRHAVDQLKEN